MQTDQAVSQPATFVLTASDVRSGLAMTDCIAAVEEAFRKLGNGSAARPVVSSLRTADGGYHIKSALFTHAGSEYFVSKTNANYPANASRHGLPTVQGTIVVHDAANGALLAVMDSTEITAMRTAAATAVAAKYLSRTDSETLAIVGCGLQGFYHVRALSVTRPLRRVRLFDVEESASRALARRIETEFGFPSYVAPSVEDAASGSDIVATCTTSTSFLLDADAVRPGTFVAGVGVDAEHKRELTPALLQRSKVVVDLLEQCAAFGDLRHALDAGVMRQGDVHSELGNIVAGAKTGRSSDSETFVFDSTGMALQDAATAVLVLAHAGAHDLGARIRFSA
jgi:alanine dehydrogenase